MKDTWMNSFDCRISSSVSDPESMAKQELASSFKSEWNVQLHPALGDAYEVSVLNNTYTLSGGRTGILYGAYDLLIRQALGTLPNSGYSSTPAYALRMIDCWDNMSGDIERGYAGRSLFFENNEIHFDSERIRFLGRMLASVGLNVLCINNVNVHEPAQELVGHFLPEVAEIANLLRPFGIRLMISIDFSQPIRDGLPTADPLDEDVRIWWKDTVKKVYSYIPDLAGFLVKADSEGRPGPFTYGRNHADGANMLAEALLPFGGVLVWRCFVYNCRQDWRDTKTDRPKAAWEHYAWLDGQFAENVILQIKHGPFDFQVREPLSPLLLGMKNTNKAMELQLTQEYTGHQIDIYSMLPMWKELFDELPAENITGISAVGNLGRDQNYTGHPFAALNLFGFGKFSWNPNSDPLAVTDQWIRLTYRFSGKTLQDLTTLLMGSRRTYEKYTSPLGLGWMITPHDHYGPNPSGYEYDLWGTYHKANREAVGIDRTSKGTDYLSQYPEMIRQKYENPDTCPDLYLLFFHRVRYTKVMSDGRTLIQRIYDDHFEGFDEAVSMSETLKNIPFPEEDRDVILSRMEAQIHNAREWRDIINTFFYRLSGIPDAHGRTIWE